MRHILITGGTGYLGTALATSLSTGPYRLILLTRSPEDSTNLIHSKFSHIYHSDTDGARRAFHEHDIDAVIHLATVYGRHGEQLETLVKTNVELPLAIIEQQILQKKTSVFINADTSLEPFVSDYALSKSNFRDWLQMKSATHQLCAINARLEHIYGPGDSDTKFITHLMRSALSGERYISLTHGTQKRDFIYISDAVNALNGLLNWGLHTQQNGFHNIPVGSGQAISIQDICILIKQITKSEIDLRFGDLPYRKNEPMLSVASLKNIRSYINWEPLVTLDEGLAEVMKYEKNR